MSGTPLVQIGPQARLNGREVFRIALSMTLTCAIGALVLGAVYLGTDRYQQAARIRSEQAAVSEMLSLGPNATVTQIHQYLDPAKNEIVYRVDPAGNAKGQVLAFTLDGALLRRGDSSGTAEESKGLHPLGRIFVAQQNGVLAGFVTEGETQGYKNRIRYFVAIDPRFDVAGVRVVEHEEDPGLGAEVATPWFQRQFIGRPLDSLSSLDVARDPLPEDWAAALRERGSIEPSAWRSRYLALIEREQSKPIYAVTGATISSRALTNGVRAAAHHFERRWALLEPYLEEKR